MDHVCKLDILVFASHPDDAELGCAGTILKHVQKGYKVGIVDLTQGELGTRGSVEIRTREAAKAGEILGLTARENLQLSDGFFDTSKEECLKVISVIRKYQPGLILANAVEDRHPDHGMGSKLVSKAGFLSGLSKIETYDENGMPQPTWRANHIFHYIQDRYLKPDFVVDITPFWDLKMKALKAYTSQFFDSSSKEPVTYISSPDFFQFIEGRASEMGHSIGTKYGEGFIKERQLGIEDLIQVFGKVPGLV